MTTTLCSPAPASPHASSIWRDIVMPREHGSWSLALEPIALGLLLAPSVAGGCLALATFGAFLARRPLKLALGDPSAARRASAWRALVCLSAAAGVCAAAAVVVAGAAFAFWLLPAVLLGAVFLWFDLRQAGREQAAELSGSAAFALVTGPIVAAAGGGPAAVLVANFLMLARSVPTVLLVRAIVRGNKSGTLRPVPPLAAASTVAAVAGVLAIRGIVDTTTAAVVALLLVRAVILLTGSRSALRARTLGMIETATGLIYLGAIAVATS